MGNLIGGEGGRGEAKEKEFVRGAIYIYTIERNLSKRCKQISKGEFDS